MAPSLLDSYHINGDTKLLLGRTDDNTVDRRDISKIATDGEDDVIVLDQEIVSRIEAYPTELIATPERHPGMSCVGALKPELTRRRDGAQVTADIGRRQAETAET